MAVELADLALALRRGQVLADDGSLHSTVQAAENAASSFIWLPPETFSEAVTVDTPGLVVMGSGRDTLIDGGTSGDAINITAADVVVTNLSVQTTAQGDNSRSGITSSSDGTVVSRVWVRDADRMGVFLSGADSIVSICVIEQVTRIGIVMANRSIATGCVITNAAQGGTFTDSGISPSGDDGVVSGCIINNSGDHGVHVRSNDCLVVGNRIIGSGDDGLNIRSGEVDAVIANNNITGSTGSDINDLGTNTLIDANVPSLVLTVDDFESGNITSVTAPWNNWAGDTGSFSSQTGTVLSGSRSGQLAAANANVSVRTDRNDEANEVTQFQLLVQISNQSANAADQVRVSLRDSTGTEFAVVEFEGDGDILDSGGADQGDWAAGTEYEVTFSSIDFDAETYDWSVVRTSDSTTVASVTGDAFASSVSGIGRFLYRNDSTGSGQTTNAFIDNIQTTR